MCLFIILTGLRKLCAQLKGSVSNKENTSIVIIGPKSSGKSLLVDSALKNLFASYPNQKFKLCNIRGQYIQTEAGCVTTVKNELKHVGINEDAAACFDEEEEDVDDSEEKLGQNMETLTSQIIELSRKGYCLIFVMDDFHVISQVAKKAVYHIADTSHMNNVTSIMIGITPSTTININLDRRIKSRFLNRQLYTFLPKNVPQVCDFFRYYLTLPVDPRAKIRKLVTEEYIHEFNSHLNECLEDRQIQSLFLTSLTKSSNNFYKSWMVRIFVNANHCRNSSYWQ
jgi:origin recognition complex subunit 4